MRASFWRGGNAMSPGDAIIYVGSYGGRAIIETTTPSGHLGLRYVDPRHVRAADNGSGDT